MSGATRHERTLPPLTRTDIVRYAGASGDFNPIHHDEEYAVRLGLPSVFAMGMLVGGSLGSFLADRYGADNIASYQIRFRGQVWPGDEVTLTAEPVPDGAPGELDVAATVGDRVVVSGRATLRVSAARQPSEEGTG